MKSKVLVVALAALFSLAFVGAAIYSSKKQDCNCKEVCPVKCDCGCQK